mmetsp:Transcript_11810/g.18135  ORF Transcript_11810/g.18135 Transcript_11810/m.18135 type:complete len:178 (-) Transcript_11810:192-725(-)
MKTIFFILSLVLSLAAVSASVFLPHDMARNTGGNGLHPFSKAHDFGSRKPRRNLHSSAAAMAIPGYGTTEQIFIGGFSNFLNIYNILLTVRILSSWIPQAQGVAALQPLYQITDPFLNLFRGIIPPLGGLDFSPIASFFLLSVITKATVAVGAEIPKDMQKKLKRSRPFAPYLGYSK